jgi:hypothetical protein
LEPHLTLLLLVLVVLAVVTQVLLDKQEMIVL